MRRVVARFDDEEAASDAERSLRETDREPHRPEIDDAFFDPSARPPEARGLAWGGLVGGVLGAALLLAMAMDVVWLPRLSPLMTAGRLTLVVFGFGAGAAVGGFVGGLAGTYRDVPEPDGPRVAVAVPDHRVDETTTMLRGHGATAVDQTVLVHEHPHREQIPTVSPGRQSASKSSRPAGRAANGDSNPATAADAETDASGTVDSGPPSESGRKSNSE
ncbi:hypothetical protein [Halosimplex amylolyticum]|uniref:hypothetical protein n=1 Tax=Halosimplex amylolyticum TaxID=3396616 RepID=UPI003F569357